MSIDTATRTILLTLESADDMMALEAATELAALLRGTLHGVFVENQELLRLARLPFAHEVSLTSAAARRLQAEQLERDFKVQAEQVRRQLERYALRRSVEWSFRVERGAVISMVTADTTLDIAVVGRPQARAAAAGTLVVPYDGSPGTQRALELAITMSAGGEGLLVLLPAAATQLRAEAGKFLATRAPRAHALVVTDFAPQQLAATGRRYGCRMLLVGADLPFAPSGLQQLLNTSHCPVALVR